MPMVIGCRYRESMFLLRRNNVSSMITQGIFCYNLPPMWPFRKSDPGAGVILWGSYAPKMVEGEIVSLYIDHGREDNADYQYLILPASTAEKRSFCSTGYPGDPE